MSPVSSFGPAQAGALFDPLDPDVVAAEQAGLGDVSVDALELDVASAKEKGLGGRIDHKLVDGTVILSMSEAPTLNLTVTDPSSTLLTSGLFAYKLDIDLDEVPFRLVEVDGQNDDTIALKSEHRLVAYCREHDSPRKFSRGHFTRAEAARALVMGEIKAMKPRFVSPDLHKTQKLAKPDTKSAASQTGGGFADGAAIQRNDGHVFLPTQIRNAEMVLDQASEDDAPPKATLALVEACIVEGPNFDNPTGGDGTSSGILQLLSSHLKGSTSTHGGRRDIKLVCHLFLTEGFTGAGGAIPISRQHPDWTAGQIAQACQGSAYPRRYDAVRDVAKRVIDHYKGGGASFGGGDSSYYKSYEFTRGQAGKAEDTWICTGRWADEVRWRRFIVGQRSFYFASDDQLLRSKPRYLIDPTTVGVTGRPTFTLEVGGRTVIVKGRRELRPSECVLAVRLERWKAPPGSIIELADFGPLDGRWLIDSIERGIFDKAGTVHLRQPQKALPEPRSSLATKATKTGGSNSSGGQSPAGRNGKLSYPLAVKGKDLGGVAAHKARPFGNWQSDNAVDIGCPRGTAIFAVTSGSIVKLGGSWDGTGNSNPNGFNITLRGGGNQWFYTHLRYRSPGLKVGDRVKQGQYLGGSGAANGIDHLHIGSEHGDPEKLLDVLGGGFHSVQGHPEKL